MATKSRETPKLTTPKSRVECINFKDERVITFFFSYFFTLQVDGNASLDAILEDLECPVERMQAQDPANGDPNDDLYSYRRGDIPIFNFDEADRVLIATLQELVNTLFLLPNLFFAIFIFIFLD